MLYLAQRWAAEYMKNNPGISIYVEGGGTVTGAQAIAHGKADICLASRPLRPEEIKLIADKYNKVGLAILVAKDAITVYLHPQNQVESLTLEQLKKMYKGEITNWAMAGGPDNPVLLINRMATSGTFLYFKEHVLGGDEYSENSQMFPTTKEVVEAVAKNKNAIGYGGIAYMANVKYCQINDIAPFSSTGANDDYPLTRYLYLYLVDTPRGEIKRFVDWILSPEGQEIVKNVGYFPIWTSKN